jgi:DNA-binding transcriptional MerR regulator
MPRYKIGELADRTSTTTPTIRYYEESDSCLLPRDRTAINAVMEMRMSVV